MTRTNSPTLSDTGQPGPLQYKGEDEAGTSPVSLPSPNLKHAIVLTEEIKSRLHQFQTGLSVLTAEIDGKVTRHEQEVAERKQKHDMEVDELLRQMDDMKKGCQDATGSIGCERGGGEWLTRYRGLATCASGGGP